MKIKLRNMEINPTQQEVLDRVKTLPEIVQEVYFSEESSFAIGKVIEENSLSDEEGWQLADIVGLVLLGYIQLQNFVPELINRLNIDKKRAEQILHDIYGGIFSPTKQFLTQKKTIHNETRGSQSIKVEDSTVQNEEMRHFNIDTERMRQLLRERDKTVNIKNIIANLK